MSVEDKLHGSLTPLPSKPAIYRGDLCVKNKTNCQQDGLAAADVNTDGLSPVARSNRIEEENCPSSLPSDLHTYVTEHV